MSKLYFDKSAGSPIFFLIYVKGVAGQGSVSSLR